MRRGAKPTKAKVKAKPPLARRSPKDEGSRVHDLEKRLAEAVAREAEALNRESEVVEQQAATAEILRSISAAPTDYQPVFDTIVRNAGSVCGAVDAILWTADGDDLVIRAHHGPMPGDLGARQPIQGSVAGRALSEARVVHDENLPESDDFPHGREVARRHGWHTTLSVPLLRQGVAVGAILIRRSEVRPFTPTEITLLQTFADQAVIAIENVRLFSETKEALERQTATTEILKVISESPTDVQPVFDAIVESCTRLLACNHATLRVVKGDRAEFAASSSTQGGKTVVESPMSIHDDSLPVSQAVSRREVVQIPDTSADGVSVQMKQRGQQRGFRSLMVAPLLRDNDVIGTINVHRATPGRFTEKEVALLETFASQAVIAIENARLFREIADKSAQLEAASRHKSEFLANMSHELRTPLNAIIGFSEVLTERMFGELNEKQDEYLKDINASGQHLLSLINDILDLSKIEAGRMELELADFDLPSTIDNALTLVRERASRRGITLGHSVDERLGPIRGDERKVKQVLLNLLSNALKFTPEGGRIDVSARVQDGAAEIAVTDTGVGIAPEDQEAVFEEFRQVGTADKKVEGTGLGLALSRKFIELHGGKIWVKSQVGHGSTFTFTLPVRRED